MKHLQPYEHPTWHERSYAPGTPQSMWFTLRDEGKYGSEGNFGHHCWAERHPSFTDKLSGLVWLPSISIGDVPARLLNDLVIGNDGKVYMIAIVDSAVVPSWVR